MAFTDTFTNTNGTSLPSHNADYTARQNTYSIQNNAARAESGQVAYVTYDGNVDGGALDTDHYISGIFDSDDSNGSQNAGLMVRALSDTGYWYSTNINGGGELYRCDSLSSENTTVLDTMLSFTPGSEVELQANGTSLSLLVNSVEQMSATDSTYSTGTVGMAAYNGGSSAEIASIEIGNLGGGGGATSLLYQPNPMRFHLTQ